MRRAALEAAPVLAHSYYGPVEGRVVAIDRSAGDAVRLTLDRVRLEHPGPGPAPHRVRISLHGDVAPLAPVAGQWVAVTAHLAPPGGPVEPGGFDFRRHAWFLGLGAVGYAREPMVELAPPGPGAMPVQVLRRAVALRIAQVLPGATGAFAVAVTTGDRSAMGQAALEDLRAANLAHLLAISGLHMGLLAGVVFAAVRLALALWPWVALRWPVKKIAALAALTAASGYLALSGGNVATERAFVMAAVMLVAVLADRRALSLRAVALAALIVLLRRPEALTGPGFQMSFAATVALVTVFGALRDRATGRARRWFDPVLAVVISSAVAGAATAPFGAAHFNQISRLGLIANLLSVPMMGAVVMPSAVAAACLAPFGAEALALKVMGLGLDWILRIAHAVAAQPGAIGHVAAPPPAVLPLLSLGALLVCLWRGWPRWLGLAPLAVALALWATVERPALLVAENGGLVGLMTAEGRALSRERGAGFVARVWLENDGDPADQATAAARWRDGAVRHVTGARRVAGLTGCGGAVLVVTNAPAPPLQGCRVIGPETLSRTGAVSLVLEEGGARIVASDRRAGAARPWHDDMSGDLAGNLAWGDTLAALALRWRGARPRPIPQPELSPVVLQEPIHLSGRAAPDP